MKDYDVKITESWKPLSAREKIMLKNFNDAVQLDEASKGEGLIIDVQNYAVCEVHNEKSDNKDYQKIVIVDKDGMKYVTGSPTLFRELTAIIEELADAGEEDCTIKVYQRDSKNYKGKTFITCTLV